MHHIAHWRRDSGPTDTANLAAHCPFHHDAIHRGKAEVTGNADVPDGLVHRLDNGSIIRGHTKPTPPGLTPPPGPPPGHTYRHPPGEPIHNDMVWFASAPPSPTETAPEAEAA